MVILGRQHKFLIGANIDWHRFKGERKPRFTRDTQVVQVSLVPAKVIISNPQVYMGCALAILFQVHSSTIPDIQSTCEGPFRGVPSQ